MAEWLRSGLQIRVHRFDSGTRLHLPSRATINLFAIAVLYPDGMRLALAMFLALIAACASPSPQMRGGKVMEASAGNYPLTIWRKGTQVEIIRHGYAGRADQASLRYKMAKATEAATGCALRPGSIEGDSGVLRARLDCD